MAQSIAYFTGFETGDASELVNLAGASIQNTTVRSGGYAYKGSSGSYSALISTLSSTQSVIRFYLFMTALPSNGLSGMLEERSTSNTTRLQMEPQTSGKLRVRDGSATLGLTTTIGNTVLSAGVWYRIEVVLDLAAGGVVQLYIDGVLELNLTHTNDVTAAPTGRWGFNGQSPMLPCIDDVRIDVGGLTPIGPGACIARQPLVGGTPTYDQWTKSSGTDAGALWNATPFDTANFCSDSTSLHAQTAVISPFSAVQSGHGTQVVGAGDTVNAAKTGLVYKRATAGSPSIRRRVNGTDTDTVVTGGTTDAYRDDGIWTTTSPNLDLLQAGMLKAADANLTTVEDVWVMVDYSPLGSGGYVPQTGFYGRPENYTTPAQSARQFPAAAQQFAVYPEARGNVPSPTTPQGWHAVFPERIARPLKAALQQYDLPVLGAYSLVVVAVYSGWQWVAPDFLPRRPMAAIGWTIPAITAQTTPYGWTVTLPDIWRWPTRVAPSISDLPLFEAPSWTVSNDVGEVTIWRTVQTDDGWNPLGGVAAPVVWRPDIWDNPKQRVPSNNAAGDITRALDKPAPAPPGNTALWSQIGHTFRRTLPPPHDFFRLQRSFPRIASQPSLLGVSANPTLLGVSTNPTLLGQSTNPSLSGEV